ncbi:hydroxycarboxylic acid receptor 2 [Mastacembelus armatus]|nr:hydroxycarboxylic acid receptor 2-like [Mastacembelus armatus]
MVTGNTSLHCPPLEEVKVFFLPIVMIIEMIVGLPGNMIALWIFCFRMKLWKPHTLFLFNLVLADFLLIVSVPFRIHNHLRGEYWIFGQTWCQINLFMLAVNRSASIAFMTAVALDRYFKVVHPHHSISRMTLIQAGWLSGLLWAVVIALRIPLLTTNHLYLNSSHSLCRSFGMYKEETVGIKVHYVAFTVEFFLPWLVLLYCSARITCFLRQRQMHRLKKVQRSIRTVAVISLVFTICFMPGVIIGLWAVYIKKFHPEDCETYKNVTTYFVLCIAFTYLNSTLDPLIYCFSSSIFHDTFKTHQSFQLCGKKCETSQKHRSASQLNQL